MSAVWWLMCERLVDDEMNGVQLGKYMTVGIGPVAAGSGGDAAVYTCARAGNHPTLDLGECAWACDRVIDHQIIIVELQPPVAGCACAAVNKQASYVYGMVSVLELTDGTARRSRIDRNIAL